MATDLADYSAAVQVLGGSVSIVGTATVSISGTPNVTISGTPTVNIGTAPTITITGAVSISSGSVTVTGSVNANITGGSVSITAGTVTVQTAPGTPIVVQPGVPGLKEAFVTGLIAASNGTLTVIPAVAGKTITVYRAELTMLGPIPAAAILALGNAALSVVLGYFNPAIMSQQVSEYHASALNLGDGLLLINNDPTHRCQVAINVNYTQA